MINPKDIIQSSAPTSNITVNTTPIASVPRPQVQTQTPTSPPVTTAAIGHRPVAVSIFLWLILADLTYKMVATVLVILKLISSFRANHLLAHLFENSPLLCLAPFVIAIMAVMVLFLIFKTSSFSKFDHRLTLVFSTIIPISLSIFLLQLSKPTNTHPILSILNETNLLFIILIIILLIFSRNLPDYSEPMTDGSTIALALLGSIILFPSFFFTYSLINTSLNPDTKHDSIQSMVSHKVYTPLSLPLNLRPDTTFYVDEQKSPLFTSPVVKIAYSTAINTKSSLPRPVVIISQTKVIPEFDLENYMNSQLNSTTSKATPIEVGIALNQKALVKSTDPSTSPTLHMTSLAFITPDYILVNLISPSAQITPEILKTIADNLR